MVDAFKEATTVFLTFCLVATVVLYMGLGFGFIADLTSEELRAFRAFTYASGAVGAYGTAFFTHIIDTRKAKREARKNNNQV